MKRLADQHREKVALLERQFLQQKQQLLRGQYRIYFISVRMLRKNVSLPDLKAYVGSFNLSYLNISNRE